MNNMQESPSEWDLTIVTVCRNVKDSILKTVQSVLAQKKKTSISIEHIYVDGASTDGTPELLEQLLQNGDIEQYVSEPTCVPKFFLNSDGSLIEENNRRQIRYRLFSSVVESMPASEVTHSPHLYV